MTNYPYGFDNNITLPGVTGSTQEDTAITALRSAVFAIETELGITPSGIYPDVRTRLDILEARIQFGISPNIPNDGYVKSPLFIWNVPENVVLSISDGYGAPTENRLSGSLYMRSDGTANNELYVRRGTQWSPIQTDLWMANGDLQGNYLFQEVIGIRNKPLSVSLESLDGYSDGYHLTWDNADGYWRAETGFIANLDLAPAPGSQTRSTGRTAQKVVGIQGRPIASYANNPSDGYALIWEGGEGHWEPQALAVVFQGQITSNDGYVTKTNLRSNRKLQSPSTLGFIGMTNFGTSTTGSGGVSANYASILGGDRNTVTGIHGLVVTGFNNTAVDGYSVVINGNSNTATTANSTVINGISNTSSGNQSHVGNGISNTASALSSFVMNGNTNTVNANYSGILNGTNNTISSGAIHSGIMLGTTNQILGGAASNYSFIAGGTNNTVNGSQNAFLGVPAGSTAQGNYSVILSGVSNTIATLADYAIILSGNSNSSTASSEFSLIGSGNNNSTTFHYSTILNGDTCTVNGFHGSILNGANNLVTGDYGTIINGNNNSITGSFGYGLILDGYNNLVTGPGGFIADGYNNTINGSYSSILNGNFNTINGRNSSILNGAGNTIDLNSVEATVVVGENNSFTNSANSTAVGSNNTFTNATSTFIVGTLNNVQSTASFINGSTNTLLSGTSFNRMFGSNNTFGTGALTNFSVGNGNSFAPTTATTNAFAFGSNNIIDGVSGSSVNGQSNISNANLANIHGQFGKARMFGQEVRANSRFTGTTITAGSNGLSLPQSTINVVSTTGFPSSGTVAVVTSAGLQTVSYVGTTPTSLTNCTGGVGVMSTGGQVGKIGEAQWSRIILTGTGASGSAFNLQLQDSSVVNPTFQDGYAYDLSVKILVVNTSGTNTYTARFYIDILAHQDSNNPGVLIIDNVNRTLTTPQANGANWSVSVSGDGLAAPVNNQLAIQVDLEAAPYAIGSPSNRRAIATIDIREMSRI
jgi:hypothetical protein